MLTEDGAVCADRKVVMEADQLAGLVMIWAKFEGAPGLR